jgi:hypothetical protein
MTESDLIPQNVLRDVDRFSDEDIQLVLDYLISHKMEFIQNYLREKNLPFSGTKAVLRSRLNDYLNNSQLIIQELIDLLNKIEGWGNQHIYLYIAPSDFIDLWRDEDWIREHLNALGLIGLLNQQRPLFLPEEATLSSIEWSSEKLRLLWVEKRLWEERVPEEDIVGDDLVWRAYRPRIARGVTTFDWDLISGNAMLMILQLPRGSIYKTIKNQYENILDMILEINRFERVLVNRAIYPLEQSGEVRRRQLAYATRRGSKANLTSSGRSTDTYSDLTMQRVGQALGAETSGWLGNFYWHPVPNTVVSELHCKIYAVDQRIGIFGERLEQEVRYVVSRIRHYCL